MDAGSILADGIEAQNAPDETGGRISEINNLVALG